jgi:hypothetical protein
MVIFNHPTFSVFNSTMPLAHFLGIICLNTTTTWPIRPETIISGTEIGRVVYMAVKWQTMRRREANAPFTVYNSSRYLPFPAAPPMHGRAGQQ